MQPQNPMMSPQSPYNFGQPNQPQPPLQPAPQYTAASQKKRRTGLLVSFIVVVVLLIGAIGFGVWAFLEREDYKNNSDEKAAAAAEVARQETASEKENEFLEREKEPFTEYSAPSTVGGVGITYPKTWSAFITEDDRSSTQLRGYFHPNYVPGENSGTQFALRVEVVNRPYEQEMRQYESMVRSERVTVSPYRAPKVDEVLGSRIVGEINTGQRNSMVVLPVRDKTLKIWTESNSFLKDLNNIILPNLVFTP